MRCAPFSAGKPTYALHTYARAAQVLSRYIQPIHLLAHWLWTTMQDRARFLARRFELRCLGGTGHPHSGDSAIDAGNQNRMCEAQVTDLL